MNKEKKKKILKFPKNFLWGASTSAYQIEGGITNDWTAWEMSNKRLRELKKKGLKANDYICGKACDSYNRYEEDAGLLKKINCNSYRLSLEWSRLEPVEGEFNEEEFEHYKKNLRLLKKNNIKVILTIWHWTNPIWLSLEGGWSKKKVVRYYSRFVAKVVDELGDLVDYWVTLNEPMVHAFNGYLVGKFPPRKKNLLLARKVFNNLILAHKRAYGIIHDKYPRAQVGIAKLTNDFDPARWWCPAEWLLAKVFNYFWNDEFLIRIKKHMDYVGADYYFHNRIVWYPPFRRNKNKEVTDMGWEIYPKGIYNILKYLKRFKKPIIILENGLADSEDKKRKDFIVNHLEYVHKAISEGIPVKGYFHWSLIGNFEWAYGFSSKFGLFTVDRETFERKMRPSAKTYAKICKNNSIELK